MRSRWPRGPPSRITRPSADFGPASSTRGTRTHAWPRTDIGARTRTDRPTRLQGTVPFQHFRVVRLMNRLLFLPPLPTHPAALPPINRRTRIFIAAIDSTDTDSTGFYPRSSPVCFSTVSTVHTVHQDPRGSWPRACPV